MQGFQWSDECANAHGLVVRGVSGGEMGVMGAFQKIGAAEEDDMVSTSDGEV